MRILAIETSCDETAVCLIEARGGLTRARLSILGNALYSQVPLHAPYGGVFPSLAMREHQKNLVPLLQKVLREAHDLNSKNRSVAEAMNRRRQKSKLQLKNQNVRASTFKILNSILKREPGLLDHLLKALPDIEAEQPPDAIAVTYGPGLEPALWVGINFARALSVLWDVPLIPINHMEGHIATALLAVENSKLEIRNPKQIRDAKYDKFEIQNSPQPNDASSSVTRPQLLVTNAPSPATSYQLLVPRFPALALLVSGGHTELVLMKNWLDYKVVGETRDDAAGEAFDKVARMLGLPYPGGPHISALAESSRNKTSKSHTLKAKSLVLPRPMLHSPDFDFSFSGLKTAVLYVLKKYESPVCQTSDVCQRLGKHRMFDTKMLSAKTIALEFENAVVEVLVSKTLRAAEHFGARAVLLGGGVAANTHLRRELTLSLARDLPKTALFLPDPTLTGDNAIMIATAAHVRLAKLGLDSFRGKPNFHAEGNLRLDK